MFPLTEKQTRLKRFIADEIAGTGMAPRFDDMMAHMQLGRSAVHRIITGLEERGHIKRLPRRARAIKILEEK